MATTNKSADKSTDKTKWLINVDSAGTYSIPTGGKYVDADLDITVPYANLAQITSEDDEVIKVQINEVSVGTKNSDSKYPISISDGSASAGVSGSTTDGKGGWVTDDMLGGEMWTLLESDQDVWENNAALDAASVSVSMSKAATKPTIAKGNEASVPGSTGAITTTKPSSGYYVSVKGTAPATSVTATDANKTITNGYLGAKSEVSASASISATTGDTYYVPITLTDGSIGVSSAKPTGYTENTDAIIPYDPTSKTTGWLKINAGYYPNTTISLATMIPDEATIGTEGKGAETIRTGTTAFDNAGNLIVGTMGNATVTNGAVTHSLAAPSYNSTTGVFDQTCKIAVAAPSVSSAGYISSTEGTKTATSEASENHSLAKVALSTTKVSGDLTKAPTLARTAKPSGDAWIDAASGAATTTKPTTAVPYVQIDAAASTNTLTIKPTVSSNGYGTTSYYGSTNWTGTVGSAKATTAYVPITQATAGTATKPTASATGSGVTLGTVTTTKPTSGKYIQVDATEGKYNVATAGWIGAGDKGSGAATTRYYPVDSAVLTHGSTATATNPTVTKTAPTVTGANTTTTATSYYVVSNASQTAAGSITHDASVSAGYTAGDTKSATIATAATVANGTGNKVYLATTAPSASATATMTTTGYNAVQTTTTAPSGPYLTIAGGYSGGTVGSVLTSASGSTSKYMKVFDGSYTVTQ